MKILFLTLLFTLDSLINLLFAQWANEPNINNAISTASFDQVFPTIVGDGAGGAIITWSDEQNGSSNRDIYAQRININGVIQWTTDGVVISTASGNQSNPTIVSDGAGGAILTWFDYRSGTTNADIYAQRINASGIAQWATDGVAISTANGNQRFQEIVSDGAGGAIITWSTEQNGSTNSDIYAQRIDTSGVVQWTANGVAISTASNVQISQKIISDGIGGAIITWRDLRSGNSDDIYAQRINADGVVQWTTNGVAISTANGHQSNPTIVSDGTGGAIITWYDYRGGTYSDIYAQRISDSGVVQWSTDGVAISTAANNQFYPTIESDSAGGAIITWYDYRGGTYSDIYAQRINDSGVVQWTNDGVAISTAANYHYNPTIESDGAGGAIITWLDYRNGTNLDIYAQSINVSGVVRWTINGIPISTASGEQINPTIVSDGSAGAIITWSDKRSGTNYDIYSQQVSGAGMLGAVTSIGEEQDISLMFSLYQNYPNPFNPSTSIRYRVSSISNVSLKVYDVLGKEITTLVNEEKPAGNYEVQFDGSNLSSGVYFYQLKSGEYLDTKKFVLLK